MAYFENPGSIGAGLPTLKRWLENKNQGKSLSDFFCSMGITKVAICDAGDIGLLLYEEIHNSDIKICAFYDRNWESLKDIDGIPILSLDSIEEAEDDIAVIVCPPESYEDIRKYIVNRNDNLRTLYLKDLVYEL